MKHEHRHRAISRRSILTTLAATAGAVALLPRCKSLAQSATRLVDTHHHYYPREIIEAWQGYMSRKSEGRLQPNVANWAPAASLEEMDKSGVATSILSLASIPGVWFGLDTEGMRRMSRLCNEFAAKMVQDHPGRYGLFASLPMPDVDGALAEIGYAVDSLKADGINLSTSFGDRWPGDPTYKPVFEELNRRKAVVFFHPYAPNCCGSLNSGVPPGDSRVSLRQRPRDHQPPAEREPGAVARHLLAAFARRRGDANGGRPRRVFRRDPQRHRRDCAERDPRRAAAPLLRHRQRRLADIDGGLAEDGAAVADRLRHGFSLRTHRDAS